MPCWSLSLVGNFIIRIIYHVGVHKGFPHFWKSHLEASQCNARRWCRWRRRPAAELLHGLRGLGCGSSGALQAIGALAVPFFGVPKRWSVRFWVCKENPHLANNLKTSQELPTPGSSESVYIQDPGARRRPTPNPVSEEPPNAFAHVSLKWGGGCENYGACYIAAPNI